MREETRCRHYMGYTFRLTAMVLLYASSHREDNIYHTLCYTQLVREETRCRHMCYSFRLTTRVLLYASSHRQDSTYHALCYTPSGALAGTRISSMSPPHEGSIRWPTAPWANALTKELHLAPRYLQCRCAVCLNHRWFGPLCPSNGGFGLQSYRTS